MKLNLELEKMFISCYLETHVLSQESLMSFHSEQLLLFETEICNEYETQMESLVELMVHETPTQN
jgi:hypothetical protein